MAEVTVYCANEDHARRTRAVSRMSWPSGRFKPTTGCVGCTKWQVDESIREGLTVIVEPVDDADPTYQEVGSLRTQVDQLKAKLARHHEELRDKRTDLLEIRGILKPAPGVGDPVVPMPVGHVVAPAVEWLAAEVERLRNRIAELEGDDDGRHIIDLRDDGWTIKHPLSCRPNLFDCPVNEAAERDLTEPPDERGQRVCSLNDDGHLLIGEVAS